MRPQSSKVTLTCEHCGVIFQRWAAELRRPRASKHTYCSTACNYQARRSPLPRIAVYAIVHLATERLYIGSTINTVSRWGSHRWKLGNGSHENTVLQAAWTRDGATAFEFRVLEEVNDATQLRVREQAWLDAHQSAVPAYGFNRDPDATSPRGRKVLPEFVERIAAAQRGMQRSAETRAKIAAKAMGNQRGVANLRAEPSLTDAQAASIKRALANGGFVTQVARDHNVPKHIVDHIARGHTYRHILPTLAIRPADGRSVSPNRFGHSRRGIRRNPC
jgi:group I intron endonuclease